MGGAKMPKHNSRANEYTSLAHEACFGLQQKLQSPSSSGLTRGYKTKECDFCRVSSEASGRSRTGASRASLTPADTDAPRRGNR